MYVNNQKDNQFNRLAAMVYFLVDYYENGIYSNIVDTIETNGSGEINWNKTINETFAILSDGITNLGNKKRAEHAKYSHTLPLNERGFSSFPLKY